MKFVLDNSVVMRWLFDDGSRSDRAYASGVLKELENGESIVPTVWPLEVANVIARSEAKKILDPQRSSKFIAFLNDAPIEVDPMSVSNALSDTLDFARKFGLTAYDASYLELAVRIDSPLATLDKKIRKAVKRAGGTVL